MVRNKAGSAAVCIRTYNKPPAKWIMSDQFTNVAQAARRRGFVWSCAWQSMQVSLSRAAHSTRAPLTAHVGKGGGSLHIEWWGTINLEHDGACSSLTPRYSSAPSSYIYVRGCAVKRRREY